MPLLAHRQAAVPAAQRQRARGHGIPLETTAGARAASAPASKHGKQPFSTSRWASGPAGMQHWQRRASDDLAWTPSAFEVAVFALPMLAAGATDTFAAGWLTQFYVDTVNLPLRAAALSLTVNAAAALFMTPVLGWLVDRAPETRFGRRRPLVCLLAVVHAVTFVLMALVPQGGAAAQGWPLVLRFGGTRLLRSLASSLMSVLLKSWAVEASLGSPGARAAVSLSPLRVVCVAAHTRCCLQLFGALNWAYLAGNIAGELAPPFLRRGVYGGDGYRAYAAVGYAGAGLLVVLTAVMAVAAEERRSVASVREEAASLVPALIDAAHNRHFVLQTAVRAVRRLAPNLPLVIFSHVLFRITDDRVIAAGITAARITELTALPVILRVTRSWERWRALVACLVVEYVVGRSIVLSSFIAPAGALVPLYFAWMVCASLTASNTLEDALAADAIDADQLKTGKRRETQFLAAQQTVMDVAGVLSEAMGIAVLNSAHYVEGAPAEQQPASVFRTAGFIQLALPLATVVMSLLLRRTTITQARHKRIVEAIAAHKEGRPAPDPFDDSSQPRMLSPPVPLVDDYDYSLEPVGSEEVSSSYQPGRVESIVSSFWHWELRRAVGKSGSLTASDLARFPLLQAVSALGLGGVAAYFAVQIAPDQSLSALFSLTVNCCVVVFAFVVFNCMRLRPAVALSRDERATRRAIEIAAETS